LTTSSRRWPSYLRSGDEFERYRVETPAERDAFLALARSAKS
jgi:hypothetical protein